ncbi:hypothetical protein A2Z53_02380 [Candidatus Giovannonibacteria bacterium RIFCSPHIGHO2_02_42_15]|uniref:Uncharacterized protein n=1 Tax=Candidatus Giovannonibacteria bacterium RIFCSPHIGHO2_02_42_15 TaxID=1798329 RepID=A0A1F5VPP8_9BACT|nr:MAG: hypothetical protein A2Z53_02380 [Candidatus Giovannonibacteria bacterium RIFCSPHIGHO2_02_42_15]
MINTNHLLKVIAAWISVVYVVCFAGVALFPNIRPTFMWYALHVNVVTGVDILTWGTFFSGLIIWNVLAVLAAWLFAALFNSIKR